MFMTNQRKHFVAAALIFIMLFSLVGCTKKENEQSTTEATTTISTETSAQPQITVTTEDPSIDLSSPEAIAEQERFDAYVMDSFRNAVQNDTISLHYMLAHPENYGVQADIASLGDAYCLSDEELEAQREEAKKDREEFMSFDYSLLTSEQKFDYQVYKYSIDQSDNYFDYYYLQDPFAYTSGLQANIPVHYSEYTFRSADDIPIYLEILALLPDYIDNALAFEQIRVEKGFFMNRHNANEVIRQCNDFIDDPEHNLLIETFNAKIDALEGIDAATADELKAQNRDIVINQVIPSFKNIITFFKNNKTNGKNDLGLCYLENGKDYYTFILRNQVETSRTPQEIAELLEKYTDQYMNELQTLAIANYDEYTSYFDTIDSVYGDIDPEDTLRLFEKEFKSMFPELPPFEYNISYVHESLQDVVSPAFYMLAPIDNYKENSIRLNIQESDNNDLWSTLCHEGIPGHMYQRNYYLQTNPSPYRAIMNHMGYAEGWATYVQFMSHSLFPDYAHPVYADFTRLNMQLALIIQARVELGVNYEGWTMADVEYYLETSGFNKDAAGDIMNYVMAEPANYQAYVVGWLEIEELRAFAESTLGDKFDAIEFHRTLLDAGPCPFPLLKTKVDEYVANNQ